MMLIKVDNETYLDVSVLIGESIPHLMRAFGDTITLTVEKMLDPETGDYTVRVLVHFAGSAGEARSRLDSFDENWWLAQIHRSHATIVFDYMLTAVAA